jgi:hypothetical protein
MSSQLESALVLTLAETVPWSAALTAPTLSGRLTQVNPGTAFDVLEYARRDREFQHRDLINAAAVMKVSVHAQTVWNGSVVTPVLQGVAGVTDATGTNVFLALDPQEFGSPLPASSTRVYHVGNSSVPYDAIQVTDKGLYARDALLYETLARAAAIFPGTPPLQRADPTDATVGNTRIWATAEGTNRPGVPNAAEPMSARLLGDPDKYLAERDNQVAAYVARIAQALKNPFAFATRLYVAVQGAQARETETYVLTHPVFSVGTTYATGEEVLYQSQWYRANYTTGTTPGGAEWTAIAAPNLRPFLAEPALSNRNRIVYNIEAKTLQWYRETSDTVHVPQIVGLYVPGVLPEQILATVPLVPEPKDAEFYRQKAARISLADGTWQNLYLIRPTGGALTDGNNDTFYQDSRSLTYTSPSKGTVHFTGITCQPGSYTLTALVRPTSNLQIAGIDLDGGTGVPANNGVNFTALNTTLQYPLSLPAGAWKLYLEFANDETSPVDSTGFGILVTLGSTTVLSDTFPLYYTDSTGAALPKGTVLTSGAVDLTSTGDAQTLGITWTNGQGVFHIRKLLLVSDDNATSHYIMEAVWKGALINQDYTSRLDVVGQRNVPDVMPFSFYLATALADPRVELSWLAATGGNYSPGQRYLPGDQVLYQSTYWEADDLIEAGALPPGSNAHWIAQATEPQIPLLVEQIQLQRWVPTLLTPALIGFAGFRQDMLERALRADQDAYRAAVRAVGTEYPEFRDFCSIWSLASTGSWMRFQDPFNPRLQEITLVESGNIMPDHVYLVQTAGSVVYDAGTYTLNQKFTGAQDLTEYLALGGATVTQTGAYRLALPGDVGQPGLVPAGLEFVLSAGTVAGWYASYASYPTHQTIQPWMVEAGIHAAQPDFWSPSALNP